MQFEHRDVISTKGINIADTTYVVVLTLEGYVVYRDVTSIQGNEDGTGIIIIGEGLIKNSSEYNSVLACITWHTIVPFNMHRNRNVKGRCVVTVMDHPTEDMFCTDENTSDIIFVRKHIPIKKSPYGPRKYGVLYFQSQDLWLEAWHLLYLRPCLSIEDGRIGKTFHDKWRILPDEEIVFTAQNRNICTPLFYHDISIDALLHYLREQMTYTFFLKGQEAIILEFCQKK